MPDHPSVETPAGTLEIRPMAKKKITHFVFWRYDQFPYVLGAMAALQDDGSYYVETYTMTIHKPLAIFTPKEGGELLERLNKLGSERQNTLASIHEGFYARLKEILPTSCQRGN